VPHSKFDRTGELSLTYLLDRSHGPSTELLDRTSDTKESAPYMYDWNRASSLLNGESATRRHISPL
jgi:hypothetical protein